MPTYTDSLPGYLDLASNVLADYLDSDPGFIDLGENYGTRYVDGAPGFLDLGENALQAALIWKRTPSGRVPLYVRKPLSISQWRRSLEVGNFFPDETNTGVYDWGALEDDTTAQLIVTEPGSHFENVRFLGRVNVRAAGVSFRNCAFVGPETHTPGSSLRVVSVTDNAATNVLFEDCSFHPRWEYERTDCILGSGFTALRCEFKGGVDSIGVNRYSSGPLVDRSDVSILGCWAHSLWMFSPCSYQSDNVTHNDVIQWHGGAGLTVVGNRLEGNFDLGVGNAMAPGLGGRPESDWDAGGPFGASPLDGETRRYGSILMISPRTAPHEELIFEKNWMDHSTVGINGAGSVTADDFQNSDSSVSDNLVGIDWYRSQITGGGTLSPDDAMGVILRQSHNIDVSNNITWDKSDPFNTSTDPTRIRYWG